MIRLISSGCLLVLAIVACTQPDSEKDFEAVTIQIQAGRLLQGDTLHFQAEPSGSSGHLELTYLWAFGDSSFSNQPVGQHQYLIPGSYVVILYVQDETGKQVSDSISIDILPALRLLGSYEIDVNEPSGLALSLDNQSLWTVSDVTGGSIVRLSLTGEILQELAYYGNDMEGISTGASHGELWVVEESGGRLLRLDTSGTILDTVMVASVLEGSGGLEGVSYSAVQNRVYLLKEKDPCALIVLDSAFNRISYRRLGFAADLSGISTVAGSEALIVISHEEAMVYELNLDGDMLEAYAVNVLQGEGIAYDLENRIFYLVDDSRDRLHAYTYWE